MGIKLPPMSKLDEEINANLNSKLSQVVEKLSQEKQEQKEKEEIQCSICLSKVTSYLTLPCLHKYCEECIVTHFKYQINSKVLVNTCPDCYRCCEENFVTNLLSPELKERFEQFKLQKKVDIDQKLHWCPRTNCGKYVHVPGVKKGTKHKATCECRYSFCINCHEPWHGSKSCRRVGDKGMKKFQSKAIVKKCPKCNTTIEKNEGCNHMTCHVCQYEFCWLCGGDYKNGRHFTFLNGCTYFGNGSYNYLQIALLLPFFLCIIPFLVMCTLSKKCSEKYPISCCIIWIPLSFVAIALGFAMIGFTPICYILLALIFLRSLIKQCRYR
ncbi:unnamed protein product [Moneuplotes crassus]|uniref:RBR-type E3 ubiquitin transferase n=1 Tax=Euplotes crassus TaxID=5936 RepID=A0AAD1URP9_EUPCR|nr:unnamed protein product [Moneuplotes crassus]